MTWQRDLAWKNLESVYQSSISYQLARYALTIQYDKIPTEVIHQAKRCLLDALGCAIGAYGSPGRALCEALVQELGGKQEATVFGSGLKTTALNATLANSFLVRYLDYNDMGGGGHNSDAIPGIVAVCEREKSSGGDLLTSLVISYELGARVSESAVFELWAERGWTMDARGGISMPPALGILMGLDQEHIANAIGLCTSHSLPLNIIDADREECVMAKNLRFGWVVHDAILSCILAKKGFTGPVRIIEGDSGFNQVILQNQMDTDKLLDFSGWRILKTRHKSMCFNGSTQGHVSATLALVIENNLMPEDIAMVRIKAPRHEASHTTFAAKKYPRNAESADHSACFLNAIAIKERKFSPETFEHSNFTDPVILDLTEKILVEADPALPEHGVMGISEIITNDGRRFQKSVDTPHGYGNDPLTDKELENKLREMADKYMDGSQIGRLVDTVWNIENIDDVTELTHLMKIKN